MQEDRRWTAETLTRYAHLLGWASRILAMALPVLWCGSWYFGSAKTELLRNLGLDVSLQLTGLQIALVLGVALLPMLALARALFLIARCFDCFALADWFGSGQPMVLARAGRWLAVSGVLVFCVPTLLGLLATFNAPPGGRALVISLSSNGALSLLFGALLWAFGQLWGKATALAAENARFV